MADLWKYCTKEDVNAAIVSLNLLDGTNIPKEKYFSCLYALSNHIEEHYHKVSIPKKQGGVRKLLVPDYLLATVQKNILKNILNSRHVSQFVTAYYPGAKIIDNAEPHIGSKIILKLDMKDFFENITYLMVYQNAFPNEYFPPAIRTLLTNLCCYYDYLPQGAVTSPMISNLVMYSFDEYMGKWCGERNINYTRYCDDMTFSGDFDVKEVENKVRSYLEVLGFELNKKKTRVLKSHQRQSVTGIVTNEKLQVSKEYRRKLRSEIYYCEKFGVREHLGRTGQNEYLQMEQGEKRYLEHLLGKVNYVLQVNPEDEWFRKKKKVVVSMLEKNS